MDYDPYHFRLLFSYIYIQYKLAFNNYHKYSSDYRSPKITKKILTDECSFSIINNHTFTCQIYRNNSSMPETDTHGYELFERKAEYQQMLPSGLIDFIGGTAGKMIIYRYNPF